jgi:AAA domain/TrwC relaxase
VGAYGSVSTGYDPGYLLRESSKGTEGYYLSAVAECGEPPGVWTGRACPGLGLERGAEIEPDVMELLYGQLLDPRDPLFADTDVLPEDKTHLGAPPRNYKSFQERFDAMAVAEPDATPERLEQLAIQARKDQRQAVMFFDFTYSADKTTSILHASLQAAAVRAEKDGDAHAAAGYRRMAGAVEDAVRAGAAAALDYLQDEAGYSRAGYHGAVPKDERGRPLARHATGRWVDAHRWVVASFLQHTSRDGDPQLHVHNAILNRVECDDGTWRTLDSRALHRARAAASAIGGRVQDELISRTVRAAYEQRPDGHGRELTGIPQAAKEQFSSRRAVITAEVAELAAEYQARHGHPPNARALFAMAQFVTLNSRRAKPKRASTPTRAQQLAAWAEQMTRAELGALDAIPARVIGSRDPAAQGLAALAGEQISRILAAAVSGVQAAHPVWSRGQLLAAIDAQLPGWLGGLDAAQVRQVLEELTSQALAGGHGVVNLEAAELAEVPAALRRPDGRSVYSPHDRALYTTRPQLDREEQLLAAACQSGGPAVPAEAVAAALGADPAELDALPGRIQPGTAPAEAVTGGQERRYAGGLRPDQAAAVWGIMTSGRPVDLLIGPAGTGKSRIMGTLAALWDEQAAGNVVGVALAENAAQVLAAEGLPQAFNIARFLARAARGQQLLGAGDLLIVDEAGMVPTAQLTALHHLAQEAGAKLLLVGDPAQLPSVGAGGAFAMLAREHGHYQLTTVQRMEQRWEREASLRLRDGDATALADYDRHGRLAEGTAEEMAGSAYRHWLADRIGGRDSLLIATTNEQAAELAARARADLAGLGLVEQDAPIPLADGNHAGAGDLVQARANCRAIKDRHGRWVANRDIWRIESYAIDPLTHEPVTVMVRRDLGRDPASGERLWDTPFELPAGYLRDASMLGYAGTVHAAQGRTVDTAHALVDAGTTRALAYVALTRGRAANYAYAVTEATATGRGWQRPGADLRPGTRPAAPLTGQQGQAAADRSTPWAPEADRFSVLVAALERAETDEPALAVQRDEPARAVHLAHVGSIWTDLAAEESGRRYDAILARVLTAEQYQRYQAEDARSTLHRQVRTAELAGHDPAALLTRAVRLRSLDADPYRGRAEDISRTLHGRIKDEMIGEPVPHPASYADRTPGAADPEIGRYMQALARHMDARSAELGERAAQELAPWAIDALGPVPDDPEDRAAWVQRVGPAAGYREQYGRHDPVVAIGREPRAPEARAAWHAAAHSLGLNVAGRDLANASDGDLWAARARYERELDRAPEHVGDKLRLIARAAREEYTEAVLARARARAVAVPEREELAAQAHAHEQRAAALADREGELVEADEQRAAWHAATEAAREQARATTAELRRRHRDLGLPSFRTEHDDPDVGRNRQDDSRPGSRYANGDTDRDPAGQQEELHDGAGRPPSAADRGLRCVMLDFPVGPFARSKAGLAAPVPPSPKPRRTGARQRPKGPSR